jgi:hypothetical protein
VERLDQPHAAERVAHAQPGQARDFDIVCTTSRFG